jgi:outer membrane lipoprotein-sorting protein
MKKLLLLLLVLMSSAAFAQNYTSKELFDKMMASMKEAKTYSFVIDMQERIKGKFRFNQYIVKINAYPYKAYVYSITPNPGAEGLLIKGENSDRACINPNRFPFITLNLSPYSMLLRRNHQYTFWQMGFNFIGSVLSDYQKKFGQSFYNNLQIETDTVSKGRSFYRVVINQSDFHFDDYTVKKGETMVTIATKLLVNDYMILEANPTYKHFDDVHEGDVIKVPNVFGKKIELYVDKINFLPLVQIIYDNKGLYSRIEFSSFVLNPAFTNLDFSRNNKKYGF